MKSYFAIAFAAAALFSMPAMAEISLQKARMEGMVIEKNDGYLQSKDSKAIGVVNNINSRRRAEYARISEQNGQPLDIVGRLAAQQVIENLPAGSLYEDAQGTVQVK